MREFRNRYHGLLLPGAPLLATAAADLGLVALATLHHWSSLLLLVRLTFGNLLLVTAFGVDCYIRYPVAVGVDADAIRLTFFGGRSMRVPRSDVTLVLRPSGRAVDGRIRERTWCVFTIVLSHLDDPAAFLGELGLGGA